MDIDAPMGSSSSPQIDETFALEYRDPKERILEVLDTFESHVERLRKDAARIEEDRDHLLTSLDAIRSTDIMIELCENDRDDIHRYVDRIISRCLTVEVRILIQRDKSQEEALHQVNHLIDGLVMSVKEDAETAKARCITYMNACSSNIVHGVADKTFESALLGCTMDDQKRVKKRLQGLLNYFDRLHASTKLFGLD